MLGVFGVVEDGVVRFCPVALAARCVLIPPNNLIPKILSAEDGVHQHSEIAVGGMVAVKEHASGFFEQVRGKGAGGRP